MKEINHPMKERYQPSTRPEKKRNISHSWASAPPLTERTNHPNVFIFGLDDPWVCLFYMSDHFFEFLPRRDKTLVSLLEFEQAQWFIKWSKSAYIQKAVTSSRGKFRKVVRGVK